MQSNYFILLLFLLLQTITGIAQKLPETDEEFEKAYQERIQQEYLFNVYIPADLTDAFVQLNKLIDQPSKEKFKSHPEAEAAHKLHFSLGRWIIHNWGFYQGSRLTHFLNGIDLFHPDDMARFIIITYHRNLNRQSLEVKALVAQLLERRQKEAQGRQKEGTVIHSEKRIRKQ
ncbi:MAG: hypothetical protein DHS20C18_31090 [Saprospiraceae bacterium]|nr:MAG: hypothetical protein DHS20C18_31090 [Saprospiraceae bacterium]